MGAFDHSLKQMFSVPHGGALALVTVISTMSTLRHITEKISETPGRHLISSARNLIGTVSIKVRKILGAVIGCVSLADHDDLTTSPMIS